MTFYEFINLTGILLPNTKNVVNKDKTLAHPLIAAATDLAKPDLPKRSLGHDVIGLSAEKGCLTILPLTYHKLLKRGDGLGIRRTPSPPSL